jgi:hypothetical protein
MTLAQRGRATASKREALSSISNTAKIKITIIIIIIKFMSLLCPVKRATGSNDTQ